MKLLKEEDVRIIEALKYDSDLKPSYDSWLNALIWEDEWVASEISNVRINEFITDLVNARAYFHDAERVKLEEEVLAAQGFAPFQMEFFRTEWKNARDSGLKWPGFHREKISQEDLEYLRAAQSGASKLEDDVT